MTASGKRLGVTTAIYGLLALVGLADAVYLSWDHYQYLADPEFAGGLCGIGSSCDISRVSAASKIPLGSLGPGLPVAMLALGFYLAVLVLAWRRYRRPEAAEPRRLLLGVTGLGLIYPAVLLVYSLVVQGSLCSLCSVLYVTNLLLFINAFATRGEPLGAFFAALKSTLTSRGAAVALAVFVVSVAASYTAYAIGLGDITRSQDPLAGPILEVDTSGRLSKGPEDAPVHIIEFADIQCPHCAQLFHTVDAVHKARPNDVRVTFIHFPLDIACNRALKRPFHPRACHLAKMVECGARQGLGFELLGTLFEHHKADDKALFDFASGLGVDPRALQSCLADPEVEAAIKADIDRGLEVGVKGTPVFLINGRILFGARPEKTINEMVDQLLRRADRD